MSEAQQNRDNVNTKKPTTPPKPIRGNNLTARLLRQKVWRAANVNGDWCMFCIVGREGSGKSITCGSILEKVDPTFDEDRVFFDPEEFLEFMNSLDADERQGKACMLDEAGVGMGVRSWYDQDQIKLNKLLQTARDDNMIIGMTLPRLTELDSQTRGRLHGFLEMREVEKGDHAVFSWKNVSVTRDENDRIYKKYPRLRHYGQVRRIRRFAIGPPSEEYMEGYESRKQEFKAELYAETLGDMGDGEDADDESLTPKEVATQVLDSDPEEYISVHGQNGREYIDKELLRADFGLSVRDAQQAKKLIERDAEI